MKETFNTPFSDIVNKRSASLHQQEELHRRTILAEAAKDKQRERQEQKRKKLLIKLGAVALAAFAITTVLSTASKKPPEKSEPHLSTTIEEPIQPILDYEPAVTPIAPPELEQVETTPAETPTQQDEQAAKVANFSEEAWEKWNAHDLDLTESDTENMIDVYAALLDHSEAEGLSDVHIAGIMGNMFQENRFRTSDGDPSMGLLQWTGPRKADLYSFASTNELDPTSIQAQVAFMFHERYHSPGEGAHWDAFLESHTVDEATRSFCEEVERAGTPNMDARLEYGQTIADFMNSEKIRTN